MFRLTLSGRLPLPDIAMLTMLKGVVSILALQRKKWSWMPARKVLIEWTIEKRERGDYSRIDLFLVKLTLGWPKSFLGWLGIDQASRVGQRVDQARKAQ